MLGGVRSSREQLAYVLIAIGALALLSRLTDGAGWLWLALVAAALLYGYRRQRTYGFLVLGCVLAGMAAGLLLQQVFDADGPFLVALGGGLIALDLIERRHPRWPWGIGIALVILGTGTFLVDSGMLGSAWFALLLIAAGAYLLWRREGDGLFPPPRRETPTADAQQDEAAHDDPGRSSPT